MLNTELYIGYYEGVYKRVFMGVTKELHKIERLL